MSDDLSDTDFDLLSDLTINEIGTFPKNIERCIDILGPLLVLIRYLKTI